MSAVRASAYCIICAEKRRTFRKKRQTERRFEREILFYGKKRLWGDKKGFSEREAQIIAFLRIFDILNREILYDI